MRTGRPAAFHAVMPPAMLTACGYPFATRKSVARPERPPTAHITSSGRSLGSSSNRVVNVDNGFGAGYVASLINRSGEPG